MLLKCYLLHRDIVLRRHAIFSILDSMSTSWSVCLIYVISFTIIIFIFITINHIISVIQTNLFFGHVCQMFSLWVLLRFSLNFCQFQPGVAYKSVAYIKKRVYIDLIVSFEGKVMFRSQDI